MYRVLAESLCRYIWVDAMVKEQFGPEDIPDARNRGLIH